MIRRIFLLAGLLVLLGASPALAQYNPKSITVNPTTAQVGGSVAVSASCFTAGSTVTFALNGTAVGTAVANAQGTANFQLTIPAGTAAGSATITASGSDCSTGAPTTVTATVNVAGATVTVPGSLPVTGSSNTGLLTAGGAALVGGGAMIVLVTRRRRSLPTS